MATFYSGGEMDLSIMLDTTDISQHDILSAEKASITSIPTELKMMIFKEFGNTHEIVALAKVDHGFYATFVSQQEELLMGALIQQFGAATVWKALLIVQFPDVKTKVHDDGVETDTLSNGRSTIPQIRILDSSDLPRPVLEPVDAKALHFNLCPTGPDKNCPKASLLEIKELRKILVAAKDSIVDYVHKCFSPTTDKLHREAVEGLKQHLHDTEKHQPALFNSLSYIEKLRLFRGFLNFQIAAKLAVKIPNKTEIFNIFLGSLPHHELEEVTTAFMYACDMSDSLASTRPLDPLVPNFLTSLQRPFWLDAEIELLLGERRKEIQALVFHNGWSAFMDILKLEKPQRRDGITQMIDSLDPGPHYHGGITKPVSEIISALKDYDQRRDFFMKTAGMPLSMPFKQDWEYSENLAFSTWVDGSSRVDTPALKLWYSCAADGPFRPLRKLGWVFWDAERIKKMGLDVPEKQVQMVHSDVYGIFEH